MQAYVLIVLMLLSVNLQAQTQIVEPSQAKLLGIKLIEADMDAVRVHIKDIGGFKQDRATLKHSNMDKFFAYSHLRDSYYVEFQYDPNGKVVAAKRLFRRSAKHFNNEYRDLQTEDVARQLIQVYGQPQQVIRKSRDGLHRYASYIWRDQDMTITLDRVGSDTMAPIFLRYELQTDRYVAKTPEPDALAAVQR